jgi:hypothetical protein
VPSMASDLLGKFKAKTVRLSGHGRKSGPDPSN